MTTFEQFGRKLATLDARLLSPEGRKRIALAVGKDAQGDIKDAVRGDLGDTSMSGWRRGSPIDASATRVTANGDGSVTVSPAGKSAGPMRVLESGRQAYTAGDSRTAGFRTRKRDGARVQKNRRVKRNVGATKGKGTWSDAEQLIDQRTPRRVYRETTKVLREVF